MTVSLQFYHSVKLAAKQNLPGAKAIYEELKSRFPKGPHKAANTGSEEAPTEPKN